ncbi:MAG: gephyrin-like molybdotransferase Glp [Desulfobacteraceae bacterium]
MFFRLKTTEEIIRIIGGLQVLDQETVPLKDAYGRILSRDVEAPEDLPGFRRSSMDGFAVRARDTFGASESLPALLEIAGEVPMGRAPDVEVGPGQAARIATGGMLPEGADAVVMVEYCHKLDERTVEVARAASPLENVIQPNDDVRSGEKILAQGAFLRPQDVGILAGLGLTRVKVVRRPRVAVLSTGDEVVPVDSVPGPGRVRDVNSHTLAAFCRALGAVPVSLGLAPDRFESLREKVEAGLQQADSVWISGGSSVGTRDMTIRVMESFQGMEILAHGVSISPGKPTILAQLAGKSVWGIPGHAASALVVAEVLLSPFIRRLAGERHWPAPGPSPLQAELSRNIESAQGRDDFIRVRLANTGGRLIAEPLFGKSGLISPLVEADGLVRVDRFTEGLYQGEIVDVIPFHFIGALRSPVRGVPEGGLD